MKTPGEGPNSTMLKYQTVSNYWDLTKNLSAVPVISYHPIKINFRLQAIRIVILAIKRISKKHMAPAVAFQQTVKIAIMRIPGVMQSLLHMISNISLFIREHIKEHGKIARPAIQRMGIMRPSVV
jgi:hypothetical protein